MMAAHTASLPVSLPATEWEDLSYKLLVVPAGTINNAKFIFTGALLVTK
jgi:hypothetical protein